jgi:hypothetical protein
MIRRERYFVSLDTGAFAVWLAISIIFISIVGFLYARIRRSKKPKADEHRDEAPAY